LVVIADVQVVTDLFIVRKLYLDSDYRGWLSKLEVLTTRARRDNSNCVEYCKKLSKLAKGFLGVPNQP
jgi:hypothetical protein